MENRINISIPAEINFSDLNLERKSGGGIAFNAETINAVCAASGIDSKLLWESDESNMAELIIVWYMHHLEQGGERDGVADDLIAEVIAEDELGSGISHRPGRG